jgi:hypothetical protein
MIAELLERQQADGGWGYGANGVSWTEPTCFALLALFAQGLGDSDSARRGAAWLRRLERSDGGFAPTVAVTESTWVTSLVLLLPESLAAIEARPQAEEWLLRQTGRESDWINRVRRFMIGGRTDDSQDFEGWPWFPGAAAWVMPTALTVLALERIAAGRDDGRVRSRLDQGRSFLLARRCRDGGWNHGSTRALGYESPSYPETTGVAMLALHGDQRLAATRTIDLAEQHLNRCRSAAGHSWLTLGLSAHGKKIDRQHCPQSRDVCGQALAVLADAAADGGNVFLKI